MKRIYLRLTLFLFSVMLTASVQAEEARATLQHNNTLTVFSGTEALRDACASAAVGDTIYLSPGTFTGNFSLSTDSITILGSGMIHDTGQSLRRTYNYSLFVV